MTNFNLNKAGQDFVDSQNRKIKWAFPIFFSTSIIVTSGIYLKLGFDETSVIVSILSVSLSYYVNIHISRNRRKVVLDSVARVVGIDGQKVSVTLDDNSSIFYVVELSEISKSKPDLTLSEYFKLADIWSVNIGEKKVYIIPDFFDNLEESIQ